MNGFILTSVIGLHPLGGLGIKDRLKGEFGEARLYITWSRSAISGKDISPVSLAINKQIFLTQLNECVTDGSITVRVILHSLTDDVRHLVELTVIDALHGVQYTALHRLKTILDSRDSTFEYHIRSIVQEPILVHACQMILHCIIETALSHSLSAFSVDTNINDDTC